VHHFHHLLHRGIDAVHGVTSSPGAPWPRGPVTLGFGRIGVDLRELCVSEGDGHDVYSVQIWPYTWRPPAATVVAIKIRAWWRHSHAPRPLESKFPAPNSQFELDGSQMIAGLVPGRGAHKLGCHSTATRRRWLPIGALDGWGRDGSREPSPVSIRPVLREMHPRVCYRAGRVFTTFSHFHHPPHRGVDAAHGPTCPTRAP
jgi:hypothetical protein